MEIRETEHKHIVNLRLKYLLKSKFKKYYHINVIILYLKVVFEFIAWRTMLLLRLKKSKVIANKIYLISPNDIVFCTLKEFNPFKYDAKILSGDWDNLNKKFDELDVFNAFKSHFTNNVEWERTEYYKNSTRKISNKTFCKGCSNTQSFIEKCYGFERLYYSIMKDGYKTQRMLSCHFIGKNVIDEVSVNLGRNGDFLFNNGAHRLSIAKLLNIERIPIRITVYHENAIKSKKIRKKLKSIEYNNLF